MNIRQTIDRLIEKAPTDTAAATSMLGIYEPEGRHSHINDSDRATVEAMNDWLARLALLVEQLMHDRPTVWEQHLNWTTDIFAAPEDLTNGRRDLGVRIREVFETLRKALLSCLAGAEERLRALEFYDWSRLKPNGRARIKRQRKQKTLALSWRFGELAQVFQDPSVSQYGFLHEARQLWSSVPDWQDWHTISTPSVETFLSWCRNDPHFIPALQAIQVAGHLAFWAHLFDERAIGRNPEGTPDNLKSPFWTYQSGVLEPVRKAVNTMRLADPTEQFLGRPPATETRDEPWLGIVNHGYDDKASLHRPGNRLGHAVKKRLLWLLDTLHDLSRIGDQRFSLPSDQKLLREEGEGYSVEGGRFILAGFALDAAIDPGPLRKEIKDLCEPLIYSKEAQAALPYVQLAQVHIAFRRQPELSLLHNPPNLDYYLDETPVLKVRCDDLVEICQTALKAVKETVLDNRNADPSVEVAFQASPVQKPAQATGGDGLSTWEQFWGQIETNVDQATVTLGQLDTIICFWEGLPAFWMRGEREPEQLFLWGERAAALIGKAMAAHCLDPDRFAVAHLVARKFMPDFFDLLKAKKGSGRRDPEMKDLLPLFREHAGSSQPPYGPPEDDVEAFKQGLDELARLKV